MSETFSRRRFLGQVAVGTAAFAAWNVPGAFAEQLTKTPEGGEGPFYPDKLPLDTDNDLLVINDKITPAIGEVTHLTGRVLDENGNPVSGAVVEIWQVDGKGVYLHSKSSGKEKADANFQGYGRFLTGKSGEYYFRTVRPVKYPGRVPHIHFIAKKNGKRLVTSQFYIAGDKDNAKDGLYKRIKTEKERKLVTLDFKPVKKTKGITQFSARGDIVVGITPEDPKES